MLHRQLVYSAVNKNQTQWQGLKVGCTLITNWMSLQGCRWCKTVQIARISSQPPYKTNKNLKTQSWVEILLSKTLKLYLRRLFKVDKSLTHQSTYQKTFYKFWMSIVRVVSEKVNLSKPHWPGSAWRSCEFLRSKSGKKRLLIVM